MKSRFEEIVDEQKSYTDDALYNITSYELSRDYFYVCRRRYRKA